MQGWIFESSLKGLATDAGAKAPTTPVVSAGRGGQVVVEMILILPVFFMILFMIMESGNLAFQTIVVHHAAYEAARVGSLVAGCRPGSSALSCNIDIARAEAAGLQVLCEGDDNNNRFFSTCAGLNYSVNQVVNQPYDDQAQTSHYDLEVRLDYAAPLIFPMTNILLADPKGTGKRRIAASVRMPIETPLFR